MLAASREYRDDRARRDHVGECRGAGPGVEQGLGLRDLRVDRRDRRVGHPLERGDRAGAVAQREAAAGQPERGGREPGIGARHDVVPARGNVEVAVGFAREPERELGRELTGDGAVHRVELVVRGLRLTGTEEPQAAVPLDPPVPRVVGGHVGEHEVGVVVAAVLDRGARFAQLDLDGSLGRLGEERGELVGVGDAGHRGQEAGARVVGRDEQRRQHAPVGRVERAAQLAREQRARRRAADALLCGHDLAEHPEQLVLHLLRGLEPVVGVWRGRAEEEAVERVVLRVQRRPRRRAAA